MRWIIGGVIGIMLGIAYLAMTPSRQVVYMPGTPYSAPGQWKPGPAAPIILPKSTPPGEHAIRLGLLALGVLLAFRFKDHTLLSGAASILILTVATAYLGPLVR